MKRDDDFHRMLGGISKDSVRNWVKRLVDQDVIEVEQNGWQVTLTLLGDYLRIATAPDTVHRVVQVVPPENLALASLKKIAEGTEELGGHVVLRIEGCTFGNGNGIKKA